MKMIAFTFAAFWAGVAGVLFAHVLRYVYLGTFGLQQAAEVLAMMYFGGSTIRSTASSWGPRASTC